MFSLLSFVLTLLCFVQISSVVNSLMYVTHKHGVVGGARSSTPEGCQMPKHDIAMHAGFALRAWSFGQRLLGFLIFPAYLCQWRHIQM